MKKSYEELQKWDFTVGNKLFEYGILKEMELQKNLSGSTFEVKADRVFTSTGNIYVELWQRKYDGFVPSGLSVTQSDFFAYMLDYGNGVTIPLLLPTEWLKERVKTLIKTNDAIIIEKEENPNEPLTKGVIIPLSVLFLTENEIITNKQIKKLQILKALKK